MSGNKQSSLMGRLAVQLKLIDMDQLNEATAEQGRNPDKRLGDILLEKGFVNARQLDKLKQVQRDVVAKHRAKQALGSAGAPEPEAARPALPRPAAPREAAPAPSRPAAAARPKPAASPSSASTPTPTPAPTPARAEPAPAAPAAAPAAAAPAPPAAAPPPAAPAAQAAPAPVAAPAVPDVDSLDLPIAASPDRGRLEQILSEAVAKGASDIHIHANAPARFRLGGQMVDQGDALLSKEDAEALALAALSEEQTAQLCRDGELDLCLSIEGVGRFRTNVYRQQRGFDIVMRSIPAAPPSLEDLGLPNTLAKFTNYHQGMVLITGPAGCGKSSTMAALVNMVNEERDEHILTVEDPIEYIHPSKRCLVNQRHAGAHTASFARALRGALREDPDVIVIGELRDLETISLAMTAAETGHFVLATLHTNNAVRTINRMIGAFPSNEQEQVRTMLSESLRAVISQRLVPTKDGSERLPALEILVNNKAIGNLIRDQKTVQIRSSLQTGGHSGMCLLEQSLNELVKSGRVDKAVAMKMAEDEKLITG
ncbi:MAG: type IV pilus twitching motility protein PilT [Myxococcota bacterium]